MKKINIVWCVILCLNNYLYCMKRSSKVYSQKSLVLTKKLPERSPFETWFEQNSQIIPLFSLQEIANGFDRLSIQDQHLYCKKKANSPILPLVVLPEDIRRTIIEKLIPDDASAVELFDTIPLLTAFTYYQKIAPYVPLKLGNQTYSIGRLFRLAYETPKSFDNLIPIAQPAMIDRLVMGKKYNLVTNDDCEDMRKIMPSDMKKNLELQVISNNYEKESRCLAGFVCGISWILFYAHTSSAAVVFGCCMAGGACYVHRCSLERHAITVKL